MTRDYQFFLRRYEQIEADYIEITDFIEPKDDFSDPSYTVGSSRLMDFCIKVGTEVETIFREILNNQRFDQLVDISAKRKNQSIDIYREVIEPIYQLSGNKLYVISIRKEIAPFENFSSVGYPKWFSIYSKYKHDKLELINRWNLEHSLFALGSLLLLVINHPSLENKMFRIHHVSRLVFDLSSSQPKFCQGVASVTF